MQSDAGTVEEYLAELPEGRREMVSVVRDVVNAHLPAGFEEVMQYGMISWVVPLSVYPKTYNKQPLAIVSLASQKQYCSLYLMCVYSDSKGPEAFHEAYRATGKRLDMGKSCVRFRKLDDLPLDVIGEAVSSMGVDEFIGVYEASRPAK